MFRTYRRVLAVPGAAKFSSAGFVARLPISMHTLGTVLLVAETTGSYAWAGAVSAFLVLVQALLSPVFGRLIDGLGQARVLLPALVLHGVGLAALVWLALSDAPVWTLFPAAGLFGGTYPQPGSLVRARWAHALGGSPLLPTAFSLESVVDEVIFVVGPVLVTFLAVQVWAPAGLLTAYGLVTIGGIALAVQRRTEPPPHPVSATERRRGSVLRLAGVKVLLLVGFALGCVFGSVEVATVAFTDERGTPGSAGWVLALLAGGSMVAGLWYGTVSWTVPAHRRLVLGVLVLAVVTVPLPLASSVALLGVLSFAAGSAISPALIAGFTLLDTLVPASSRTEGLGWFSTGIGFGVGASSSITGQVVDATSGRTALLVTAGSGVLAGAIVLAGARRLRPASAAEAGG